MFINGLKLGHNLVKRKKKQTKNKNQAKQDKTQIKFSDWSNKWGHHTQRQDKSYIAKPHLGNLLLI